MAVSDIFIELISTLNNSFQSCQILFEKSVESQYQINFEMIVIITPIFEKSLYMCFLKKV